jgi:predicted RNase H-like HicB family nuclease
MRSYIGLIHKDPESDFGISFPDFPGCISAGSTLEEVHQMGAEALVFHIEGLSEDGEAIPEPSSLDVVMRDPENRDGVAVLIAVPASAALP